METNVDDSAVKTFADSRTVIDLDLERLTLFLHLSLIFFQPVDKNFEPKRCVEEREFDFFFTKVGVRQWAWPASPEPSSPALM